MKTYVDLRIWRPTTFLGYLEPLNHILRRHQSGAERLYLDSEMCRCWMRGAFPYAVQGTNVYNRSYTEPSFANAEHSYLFCNELDADALNCMATITDQTGYFFNDGTAPWVSKRTFDAYIAKLFTLEFRLKTGRLV